MATPTLQQIRDVAVAWWQEPGRLRLDVLSARLAALWTDTNAIIRVRIENRSGVYTLVAELERNGTIATREWTPTSGVRQETLGDVYCQEHGSTLRTREARVAAGDASVRGAP